MQPSLIESPDLTERAWSLPEAYQYCTQRTRHYENFPVGSRLIPPRLRRHVHAIYAFARIADDFADEPGHPDSVRMALLENWESQLLQAIWRRPRHPVFIALQATIAEFDLPVRLFQDLITAFRMDVVLPRRERFDDLLDYCRHSANPIGRLVLLLFGYRDPELHALSDAICSALQLTNFWQDLALDLERERYYIPAEALAAVGLSIDDLRRGPAPAPFRRLMTDLVARTRERFEHGRPLCRRVGRDLRWELNWVWLGGTEILRQIEAHHYDVLRHRPTLTRSTQLGLALRAAGRAFLPRP